MIYQPNTSQLEIVPIVMIKIIFLEKIKALNQLHSDKIRSLMNSIQLLKKENKNLEKLTKEHK